MGAQASKASEALKADLPVDVIRVIVRFLEIDDVIACTTVSKLWHVATSDWQVWKGAYAQSSFLENLKPALASSTEISIWRNACLKISGRLRNLPKCKDPLFHWKAMASRAFCEISWCHGNPWVMENFEGRLCVYELEGEFGKDHPQTLWAKNVPVGARFLPRGRVLWGQRDPDDSETLQMFLATLPPANATDNLMEVSTGPLFSTKLPIAASTETPSGRMMFFISESGRIFALDSTTRNSALKWTVDLGQFDASRSQIICADASESTLVVMSMLKSVDDRVDLHFYSVATGNKVRQLLKLPGRDDSRVYFVDDTTCTLVGSQNISIIENGSNAPRMEAKLPVSIYSKRVRRVHNLLFVLTWDDWDTYDVKVSVWRIVRAPTGPNAAGISISDLKIRLELVHQLGTLSRPASFVFITDELEMFSVNSVPRQTYLQIQKMSFVPNTQQK